jgi:hypothetical protein
MQHLHQYHEAHSSSSSPEAVDGLDELVVAAAGQSLKRILMSRGLL